jgi:CDP-diacylglycerol--serine O-phosphatidyltransferase
MPIKSRKNQADQAAVQKVDSCTEDRHFALIRAFSTADFITLGNAVMGSLSIFLCLAYLENDKYEPYIVAAFLMLPIGLMCDIMDGYIARCSQQFSPYGTDLDSLADLVTFSVAPAALGFTLGLGGLWDCVILCTNISLGISRLARYNVTADRLAAGSTDHKVAYYEGVPLPTNLVTVALLAVAYYNNAIGDKMWGGHYYIYPGHFHPLSLVYLVVGLFLIATFRIPKP